MNDSSDSTIRELRARVRQLERETSELIASRNHLRAILDSEPACVKLLAADGSLLDMNAAGLAMLEAGSLEQVRNHCVYPLIAEEHRAAFRALVERALHGTSGSMQFEIIGLKGGRRWLETHSSPLRDEAGSVIAVLGITHDISERRRIDLELAESEQKFSTVFHANPAMLVLTTSEGKIVDLNRAYAGFMGYSREEMLGRTVVELGIVSDQERQRSLEFARRSRGSLRNFEVTIRIRDGSTRRVLLARDEILLGGMRHHLISLLDITEREKAEQALRETQSMLAMAVEASNTGLWNWNLVTNEVYFSPIWKRQLGYADDEIASQFTEWLDRLHPDDRESAMEKCNAYLKNPTPLFQNEFRMRHKDGTWRWILTNASLRFNEQGQPANVLGAHIDITERKLAEQALHETQTRLALAVDASNTGLWDWNLHDNTVFYSTIWKRQLGYADDEIGERFAEWQDRVHPDDLAPALARIEAHLNNPSVAFENEFRMRHKDGSWRWILAYGSLRHNTDGQPSHLLGAHIDITERKNAELELRENEQKYAAIFGQSPLPQLLCAAPEYRFIEVNDAWVQLVGFARDELLGRTALELGIIRDTGHRRGVASARNLELTFYTRSGQPITALVTANPIVIRGREYALVSAQDITDVRRAETLLARHEELLRMFVRHSPVAMAMFDRDMRYLVYSQRYVDDFHLGNCDLMGRCHYDVFPEIPERWKQVHARCQAGASESCERDEFRRADGQIQWVRWQIGPWHESNGAIGGIILFTESITERVRMEIQLQEALLRHKLLAQRLADAQDVEQKRLSVELHDRIGQSLTALGINLGIIESSAATGYDEATAARLRDSRGLLRSTIASVRSLISELRPAVLDDYGLLAGLRWYAEQVFERTGLAITVRGTEPDPRLETRIENTLFRIAQEVLNNVVKHAQAKSVELDLTVTGKLLRLEVADDGCGFDPQASRGPGPRTHWGLEMIAERARAIGAHLQLDSAPGKGTRVLITLYREGGP